MRSLALPLIFLPIGIEQQRAKVQGYLRVVWEVFGASWLGEEDVGRRYWMPEFIYQLSDMMDDPRQVRAKSTRSPVTVTAWGHSESLGQCVSSPFLFWYRVKH